ncbi:MAG: alpha/beta hydrolase [Betaproteobacteria bacterium]|nr:alpha/beta hydrolase [Betaproteobacteria bacterium]
MATPAWTTFETRRIAGEGATLNARVGPIHSGRPAVLLLHGFPQSHVMWRKVAPRLSTHFNVVVPDLRGYGDSDKPAASADCREYSKRAMAADLVAVMRSLGHARFHIAGHDRGGRVAHRLAVDHPDAARTLVLLDIAPTLAMYEQTDLDFARSYWWWFFLIQPAPLPERLIAAEPALFLERKIGQGPAGLAPFDDDAYREYSRHVSDYATVEAMCNDYRAAATIDLKHDREDRAAGQRIRCPVHALWAREGAVGRCFDVLAEWRAVTAVEYTVTGRPLDCGHYIAEEAPDELLKELIVFFGGK